MDANLINAFNFKYVTGQEIHKVGVVLTNPEMSKHLETATLSIGKISCSCALLFHEVIFILILLI